MPKIKKIYVQNEVGILQEVVYGTRKQYSVDDVRKMIQQRLFTLDLASIYMGIPVKTLRHMIANGEITYVKRESKTQNRRLYYLDKQDMDEWINRQKQQHAFA
jgi:excisionase family DNA binding protein